MTYKLSELIKNLEAVTIKGDPDCLISGVCTIQHAQPGCIAFLTNSLYRQYLQTTQAAAVILTEADAVNCPVNAVISKNPHYTYAKIASFFEDQTKISPGIHSSAVVGSDCQLSPTAIIGANAVIGNHVSIASHVVIGPGTIIGNNVSIGESTQLDARVTIYANVKIGKRVHILSGAVIGSDGFGFANQKGSWHKVPQLGSVEIGDDVDIGANTTIDRGTVENTVIEEGVKLDNLIQVAHNVRIGAHTVIAGCVAIAGSAEIGKHCLIGGTAKIAGHVKIADQVILTGNTGVTKSITQPGMYSSGVKGAVPNLEFRKTNARIRRLDHLMQRVKTLEDLIERKK